MPEWPSNPMIVVKRLEEGKIPLLAIKPKPVRRKEPNIRIARLKHSPNERPSPKHRAVKEHFKQRQRGLLFELIKPLRQTQQKPFDDS